MVGMLSLFGSKLGQLIWAATGCVATDVEMMAASRRRPNMGVSMVRPARCSLAVIRASLAAMPKAQGPHMMLWDGRPAHR